MDSEDTPSHEEQEQESLTSLGNFVRKQAHDFMADEEETLDKISSHAASPDLEDLPPSGVWEDEEFDPYPDQELSIWGQAILDKINEGLEITAIGFSTRNTPDQPSRAIFSDVDDTQYFTLRVYTPERPITEQDLLNLESIEGFTNYTIYHDVLDKEYFRDYFQRMMDGLEEEYSERISEASPNTNELANLLQYQLGGGTIDVDKMTELKKKALAEGEKVQMIMESIQKERERLWNMVPSIPFIPSPLCYTPSADEFLKPATSVEES